jgi:hypothetical protein
MPGASGYDVAKRAKQLHPGAPVLLLVGTFEPFDDGDYEASGADACLKKPFDSQELLQRVGELMGAAGAAPAAAAGGAEAAGPEAADQPSEEGEETRFAPEWEAEEGTDVWASADAPVFEEPADELGTRRMPAFGREPEAEAPAAEAEVEPAAEAEVEPEAAAGAWSGWSLADEGAESAPAAAAEGGDSWPAEGEVWEPAAGAGKPDWEEPAADQEPAAEEPRGAWQPPVHTGDPFPELARQPAAPAVEAGVSGLAAPAAAPGPEPGGGASLSEGDVEKVARRVVELLGDRVVREVAWEVVPDLAEVVIKDRLRELESQVD